MLALIYKDYLCDEQEKKEYMNYVSKVLSEIELKKKEKYNPDNLFDNKSKPKTDVSDLKQENLNLELKENSFFEKIKALFKRLFGKGE